jgi:spore coat polysaccharide biosynthesis predicted glycosyltransferase SpsG
MYDFIFRFDANDKVGAGHFQRSFALIEKLVEKKHSIACVGDIGAIFQTSLRLHGVKKFKVAEDISCHCLVIDHYGVIEELIDGGLQFSTLILFEDMDERTHSLPVLVVNALGDKNCLHKRFPYSEIIAGLDYFLFRQDVETLKKIVDKESIKPTKISSILISLGGTDQGAVIKCICSVLVHIVDPSVNIVVLSPSPVSLPSCIKVIVGYDPEFLQKAINFDLVICGAGQTLLELIYLKQNPIGIVLAENQKRCGELLLSYDAKVIFPEDDLEERLIAYLGLANSSSKEAQVNILMAESKKLITLGGIMSSKSDNLVNKLVSYLS